MSPIEIAIVSALETLVAEGPAFAPVADLNVAADGGFVDHLSFPPVAEFDGEDTEDGIDEAGWDQAMTEPVGQVELDEVAAEDAPRKLGYTMLMVPDPATGARKFEVHATGCRDLKGHISTWSVLAVDHEEAINEELDTELLDSFRKDFKVMPCCNLKRMRAAGRA